MDYRVKLAQFDGPLDLLLHLIEEAELDICDVFVSEITSQYLAYVDDLSELDMNKASEFISMAATLVNIKSKSLLPAAPILEDGEEDSEEMLIAQLKEYKAFKRAGADLSLMRENASGTYTRLPEEFPLPPPVVNFPDASIDALYEAFVNVLNKERFKNEPYDRSLHEVKADKYTIRSQLRVIRNRLKISGKADFESLFDGAPSKMECIVTFMALLDMIMHNEISLRQSTPYGKITILTKELCDDDSKYEYMDEVEYDS